MKKKPCWMCGGDADSGEHIFKARDLKRLFDKDGYAPEDLPFHFAGSGHSRIRGPKAKIMKYPELICAKCNNDATSDFDRAYDKMSDWFMTKQNDYTLTEMNLRDVFGCDYSKGLDEFRRFCAKSLGCRILAGDCILPDNFPNPVKDSEITILQLSICRVQPFRGLENYKPEMMERVLGKGELFANISRSHQETTNEKKVLNAVWWENIGHFQINYWFNIDLNPELGLSVDDSAETYRIVHSELGLPAMKEMMFAWISR